MAEKLYRAEDIPAGATVRDESVTGHLEWGEMVFVLPGRRVIEIRGKTWPAARPEECRNDRQKRFSWYEGKVILCPGCGLDGM